MIMIHRKTYRVFKDEDRKLVYEDILNDRGEIVSFKDYQSPNEAEGFNEYSTDNLLVKEREVIDGVESSRTEYQYNSNGDIINRKLYVASELFEEVRYEYLEQGLIKRTYQHGEEIERMVEKVDQEKFTIEFSNGSELSETHVGAYDAQTLVERVKITDNKGQILAIKHQQFDEFDNLLKYEERNGNGNLMVLAEYKYENGNVVYERHENYFNDRHYQVFYEYDVNDNLVGTEIKSPSGKLLEYQKQIYDDQNRIINESGFSVGSFNAVYGTYINGENYVFEHVYEEK